VEDQEVELFDTEFACALVEGMQSLVVSVVGDPDLRLDEDVRAIESGSPDRLTDSLLVAVGRGSVDMAITRRQRGLDGGECFVRRRLVHAETQRGDVDAVVQFQTRDAHVVHGSGGHWFGGSDCSAG